MNGYCATIWLILTLLIVGACGPDPVQESKKKDAIEAAQQQAEVNLLTDASRGVAELDSRLRKALVFQDGMVMIHSQPTYGSYTVPVNTQWAVQCGLGLTVSFGASPRGDPNDIGTGPEVHLSWASFSPEACDSLGITVGKRLQAFLAGN
jgi:hypothetical protein